MKSVVVTTIQPPTVSIHAMAEACRRHDADLIVIGDVKSPAAYELAGASFMSVNAQAALPLRLAALLPSNHYSRKNIGYVQAIGSGAEAVFDTDDDNAPLPGWHSRGEWVEAARLDSGGWTNAYSLFSDSDIWPRGFPLELIRDESTRKKRLSGELIRAPIQQGLANGSPDVDAVWRLLQDKEVEFQANPSVVLQAGAWCPFNSQSTWWFPVAYPLLYLPSHVSFRMTDIWRSFIAQRCLWELGLGVVFHGPEMFQDRNPHNLVRDFEQEVPGYLGNAKLCKVLEQVQLRGGESEVGGNLHRCYVALVDAGFIPSSEMPLVDAWLADTATAKRAGVAAT